MLSITGWGATAGAIVTGAVGGVTGVAVKVKSGCVLDIFPGAGFGGSGRILMRAVSLANGVVGGAAGGSRGRCRGSHGSRHGRFGSGQRRWWNSSWGRRRRSECPRYRHTGDRWFGEWNLRHRRSRNWDVTGFRREWCRRRLRRRWPRGQVDPHGIVILRGDGISTTGWESNPDSFFFWLVGFGHGHIDGWKIRLPKIGYVVTGKLRSLGKRWCLHRGTSHFCVFRVFRARPSLGVMKYWSGDILRQPDSYLNWREYYANRS